MAKILLVHDNPDQLRAIRKTVLRAGYSESEVVEAIDEPSAFAEIGAQQFDVAVIDISLIPNTDTTGGLNVIEALRKRQASCRILGLTSVLRELGAEVLDRGGDDFVFTEWASIDFLELLKHKLIIWRRARPRTPMVV